MKTLEGAQADYRQEPKSKGTPIRPAQINTKVTIGHTTGNSFPICPTTMLTIEEAPANQTKLRRKLSLGWQRTWLWSRRISRSRRIQDSMIDVRSNCICSKFWPRHCVVLQSSLLTERNLSGLWCMWSQSIKQTEVNGRSYWSQKCQQQAQRFSSQSGLSKVRERSYCMRSSYGRPGSTCAAQRRCTVLIIGRCSPWLPDGSGSNSFLSNQSSIDHSPANLTRPCIAQPMSCYSWGHQKIHNWYSFKWACGRFAGYKCRSVIWCHVFTSVFVPTSDTTRTFAKSEPNKISKINITKIELATNSSLKRGFLGLVVEYSGFRIPPLDAMMFKSIWLFSKPRTKSNLLFCTKQYSDCLIYFSIYVG